MNHENRTMTAEETLANARVQSDPLPLRNLGFYIVSQPAEQRWPQLYLRRDGRWTLGIHSSDEEYFWPTEEDAATALSEARAKSTPPAPSAWPETPGFYWWRGGPFFRWEMMQVLAYGSEDDKSRYMVQKVEARQVTRSLHVWKEHGPASGEWVKIFPPNSEITGR